MQIGSRLGPYEVIAKLGEGGMGEVYRARDTKLGREVAIKILPEAFANDPDRLARFEREAKTLASLNHPHIAQIYGFEVGTRSGGASLSAEASAKAEAPPAYALVMELVEGEDLAQRLARGPIPIDEAIPIATQIAEALEAAHEQGIIHRDLKPANVKVRADGTVKVLDFGLAKALEGSGGSGGSGRSGREELLNSPTITSPAMTRLRQGYGVAGTEIGMILGTAAYMAPEQAKGKAVDKRADIWAFGCVLYEMLTARRAFAADDVSDTLAFVLTKDIDWSALPATTPSAVRVVLRRSLQRDPKLRLRDIGDARLQLEESIATPETEAPYARPSRMASLTPWLVAAAAIVVAAVAITRPWQSSDAPSVVSTRFVLQAPASTEISDVLLSRDGSFVVYSADRIYVHALTDFAPRALPGTESASKPFLSPDDRWVGFYADGAIKKAPIGGGDPVTVTTTGADSPGAGWIHDNRILFPTGWNDSPLMSVSADGGPVTAASTLDKNAGERGHWWPEPLPDRRHVLFTIWKAGSGLSESTIAVLDLQTGQHRRLFLGAMARFADGHLLYYHAGTYYTVGFDPTAQTTIGDPHAVLPDATDLNSSGSDSKPFGVAENGTIAYLADDLHVERTLTWVARGGVEHPTKLTSTFSEGRLDPRDERLALGVVQGGTSQIWIHDLTRRTEQRINAPGMNWGPVWHPNGQQLLFTSMRNGDFDVYREPMNGSPAEPVLVDELDAAPADWLADGRAVVSRWQPDGATSIELYDPATKTNVPLVTGSFEKGDARVSPDGKWLSVFAALTGRAQLYVRPLLKPGELQPIGARVAGGTAVWAARAKQLFYIRDTELIAAHYDDRGDRFVVLKEETIAQVPPRTALLGVTADAQRALIGKPSAKPSNIPAGVRIVLNGLTAASQ